MKNNNQKGNGLISPDNLDKEPQRAKKVIKRKSGLIERKESQEEVVLTEDGKRLLQE